MALTTAQKQALKAAIIENPTWAAFPMNSDGYFELAAVLNQPANPANESLRLREGVCKHPVKAPGRFAAELDV